MLQGLGELILKTREELIVRTGWIHVRHVVWVGIVDHVAIVGRELRVWVARRLVTTGSTAIPDQRAIPARLQVARDQRHGAGVAEYESATKYRPHRETFR